MVGRIPRLRERELDHDGVQLRPPGLRARGPYETAEQELRRRPRHAVDTLQADPDVVAARLDGQHQHVVQEPAVTGEPAQPVAERTAEAEHIAEGVEHRRPDPLRDVKADRLVAGLADRLPPEGAHDAVGQAGVRIVQDGAVQAGALHHARDAPALRPQDVEREAHRARGGPGGQRPGAGAGPGGNCQ